MNEFLSFFFELCGLAIIRGIVIRVLSVSDIPRWLAVTLYIISFIANVYLMNSYSTPVDSSVLMDCPVAISAVVALCTLGLSVECSLVYNIIWLGKL